MTRKNEKVFGGEGGEMTLEKKDWKSLRSMGEKKTFQRMAMEKGVVQQQQKTSVFLLCVC